MARALQGKRMILEKAWQWLMAATVAGMESATAMWVNSLSPLAPSSGEVTEESVRTTSQSGQYWLKIPFRAKYATALRLAARWTSNII